MFRKKSSMLSKAFMFYFVSKDLFYYFDFIALIFLFEKLRDKNKILDQYSLHCINEETFSKFFSNQNLLLKKGLRAKALAWGHLKKWCYDPNTSKLLLIAIYRRRTRYAILSAAATKSEMFHKYFIQPIIDSTLIIIMKWKCKR